MLIPTPFRFLRQSLESKRIFFKMVFVNYSKIKNWENAVNINCLCFIRLFTFLLILKCYNCIDFLSAIKSEWYINLKNGDVNFIQERLLTNLNCYFSFLNETFSSYFKWNLSLTKAKGKNEANGQGFCLSNERKQKIF